ncbi:hypothetical protein YC2023_018547 [Brassica napus]
MKLDGVYYPLNDSINKCQVRRINTKDRRKMQSFREVMNSPKGKKRKRQTALEEVYTRIEVEGAKGHNSFTLRTLYT